ncbi:hypothetical protein [Deinococcus sp.]|uniref:hypothetical protein n=1 Tax=Deinococcus sp. TaxID=47478 RepID=UPI003C7BAF81
MRGALRFAFAAYVEDVAARHWAAFTAEMEADPCTPERRRLAARTRRLSQLRRAAAARLNT